MGVLGQFQNGPIQFDQSTGAIEPRGQIDQQPSVTASPAVNATPAPDPAGASYRGGNSPADAGTTFGDSAGRGALGSDFGQDDPQQDPSPPSEFKRATINSEPFGQINSEPFGNRIGEQPFGNTIGWNTSFDEGGEVDGDGDEQGEPQSNPMSIIKSALSFGRKKMGLPLNFSDGTAQQQEQEDAPSFDDGGVIPEPGQQDDSTGSGGGTMPADPHKAIAYLAGDGAVSPEIAHALEQHVDPQGQMDQSSRTMASLTAAPDPESKFGMLQHYRTEFNGYSAGARAALDQGNVGLAAKHATEAFDRVPTGKRISFAPAGGGNIAVIVKNAVDGMRQFGGAGLLGKAPIKAGDDAWQKYHGGGEGVLSMADGGEVEDDTSDDAAPQEPEEAAPAPQQQEEDTSAQPVILKPEQFKSLLGAGYDKPLDDGWEGLIKTIMGALGPSSAEAAPLDQGGVTTVGKSDRLPGLPQNPLGATTPQDRAQGSFASPQAPTPKTNLDESNDRFANHQKRIEALADKLFPWAGQAAQRSAYVANAMEKITESEGRVDQQHAKSTGDVGMAREVFKQSQITARSDAARQAKWDTEMAKLDAKAQQGRLSELGKVIRTEMLNHPNATAQDMAAKFGAPVSVVNQLVSGAQGDVSGAGAPAPAGGSPAASSSGPREGDTRPYTVGGVTKQYKFENGQWRRQN